MKKIFVLALFTLMTIAVSAQGFTSKDRVITELHWNGWLKTPDNIKTEWYSRGINVSVMYDFGLGKSPLSVAPGLGLGFDNIYHNGFFSVDSAGNTLLLPLGDSTTFKKNKISTIYLDIPLELRFRTKPNEKGNSFKLAIGAKGGFLLSNYTKYIGEGTSFGTFNSGSKVKTYNIPNINTFRYGLTFRIGYGPVNLNAFYSVSTLFNQGAGPEINPFTVGISFNGL